MPGIGSMPVGQPVGGKRRLVRSEDSNIHHQTADMAKPSKGLAARRKAVVQPNWFIALATTDQTRTANVMATNPLTTEPIREMAIHAFSVNRH